MGLLLNGIPRRLWRMVALARHRLLMLDYDGTIAPFVADRDRAHPLPAALDRLRRIAAGGHTDLAIVSGRPAIEIIGFIDDLPVTIVGEHGWERRDPGSEVIRWPLKPRQEKTLDRAAHDARRAGWSDLLERKRTSIVLHTRRLLAGEAKRIHDLGRALWGPLAGSDFALDRIDGGLELRARGRNKGTAVLSLLSHASPGTLGTFVGDDVTDEEALEVVRDRGFGVRVGEPRFPTVAQGYLRSVEAVPEFLETWQTVAEGAA